MPVIYINRKIIKLPISQTSQYATLTISKSWSSFIKFS